MAWKGGIQLEILSSKIHQALRLGRCNGRALEAPPDVTLRGLDVTTGQQEPAKDISASGRTARSAQKHWSRCVEDRGFRQGLAGPRWEAKQVPTELSHQGLSSSGRNVAFSSQVVLHSVGLQGQSPKKTEPPVLKIRIVSNSDSSRWGSANFSCKGSHRKYFILCVPYVLCYYSTLP